MKVNWNHEKETLEKLIKEGVSYMRIGRQYGVTGTAVKKAAKKMGIELEPRRVINPNEHFNKGKHKAHICVNCGKEFEHRTTSGNKYCSFNCQHKHEYKLFIERWKSGNESGVIGKYGISKHIRRYLFEKNNEKCQICGWGKENPVTHKVPLQIHHIDGDCTNNKEENLQLLCPNCHSLTDTFGSLNEDSKRIDKRKSGSARISRE